MYNSIIDVNNKLDKKFTKKNRDKLLELLDIVESFLEELYYEI